VPRQSIGLRSYPDRGRSHLGYNTVLPPAGRALGKKLDGKQNLIMGREVDKIRTILLQSMCTEVHRKG